tara:strand:+ start:8232 stop:16688 length:8457 start_codon:yes stop_codon:yes gene_type:complete
MSTKISNLLFEENSTEIIHKTFENNILSEEATAEEAPEESAEKAPEEATAEKAPAEAVLKEPQLKIVGKKMADKINSFLPEDEALMADPETGAFNKQNLKTLCQKSLAGFETNFISSKKSKSEDQIDGEQSAPTALDFSKFEQLGLFPYVAVDKKTNKSIEAVVRDEALSTIYFIPQVGELITDPKIIKLHMLLFGIKDKIDPNKEGIMHLELKEIPHYQATFPMIQKLQAEITTGAPSAGFSKLISMQPQLKAQGTVKPEKMAAGVYESAIKGSLHKQDLSSLLFEKKSNLKIEEELTLNEINNISDEELLNEFKKIKDFLKGRKTKKNIKQLDKYIKSIKTNIFNKLEKTSKVPGNFEELIKSAFAKDSDAVAELFKTVKNSSSEQLRRQFGDKDNGEAVKKLLVQFINTNASASDVDESEEEDINKKYDDLTSSYVRAVTVSLSTDEDDEADSLSKMKEIEKSQGVSEKEISKFFTPEGKIVDSERLDVETSIKETVSKYRSAIPEGCVEIKELFSGSISLGEIQKTTQKLIQQQQTRVTEIRQAAEDSKKSAKSMKATLIENAGGDQDFVKPVIDIIDNISKEYETANKNLLDAFKETIKSGQEIIQGIDTIDQKQKESNFIEFKGRKIDISDSLAVNAITMITAGMFLEYSKFCYTLFAACDEVSARAITNFDEDFYQEMSDMISSEVDAYNSSEEGEEGEEDEKKALKKKKAQEAKMSEMAALFRVQNALSKFGISSKEARSLLSIESSSEPEQIQSSVMEAISINTKGSIINEATTTNASNPNIVSISGKVLVNFDGTLNRPVLKSMFDTLGKQEAFKKLKLQIQNDLLAVTGTKVFKDVDEETLQDLLHSYFMSEFSNAGDIAASLSKHPRITRAKALVSSKVASGVAKTKAAIRGTATAMKEGFVWAVSSLTTLIGIGLSTVLGYGGLTLLTQVFSSVPMLAPLATVTSNLAAALGKIYATVSSGLGIGTGVAGAAKAGTGLYGLYTAAVGKYLTAGTAGLAGVDPLLNFMYQSIAYPLGGISKMFAAKTLKVGAVFSWSKYWAAMTAGVGPIKASLSAATTGTAKSAGLLSGTGAFWSTLWKTGSVAKAVSAKAAASKTAAAVVTGPMVFAKFMTTGFWGPLITGAVATYASYRLIKWILSEDKVKNVKVGEVIEEMLKLYVLSTAANTDPNKIANYLGLTDPAERSLMSQRMQPTSNEIQLITELLSLPATSGDSFVEAFNAVNKAGNQADVVKAFRNALDVFEDIFAILEGTKNHGRDTSSASDWFKNNKSFNNYTLSKTVDVRAFTVNKLRDLLAELNGDLILIQSGSVGYEDFIKHYKDGMIVKIVQSFLKGSGDQNSQTLARGQAFDLISTKEDVVAIIESLRNQQLNSMTNIFNGTPKFDQDPLLKILATIKDKPDVESFDGLQINMSNIIRNIDKHVPKDSINVEAIIKTLKSKAGGLTHGVVSKYFLKGNRVMQAIKGIAPLVKNEQQKYAKEFSDEIAQVLSTSMQYCVDPVDLFVESKHPIFINHLPNQEGLLTEDKWLSAKGLAAATAGVGIGAYSYVKGVSLKAGSIALAKLASVAGTALASKAVTAGLVAKGGAAAGAITFGVSAGIIIFSLVAAYGMATILWGNIGKIFSAIKDKIDSGRYFNPWEDSDFVKAIRPLIVKAGQAIAAEKYMGVIFALKSKLEKLGIKVTGFNHPAFKDLNTRLESAKQISQIKNNLTPSGDKLRAVFRENMYHAKASLPREGLGKYLDDSTIDVFLDQILFGTNSPLQDIFKHSSMSDTSSSESFVYQKGLGLLLEEEEKDKKITLSMSEIYTKLADRVEEYFKSNLNYNERITVDIQEPLDDLMRDWIGGRIAGKLGRLGQTWKGKQGSDYVLDAISSGTGLPKKDLASVLRSQGVKLENKNTQGNLLLEALHTQDLKLLVEVDKVQYVLQDPGGKGVAIFYQSDVAGAPLSVMRSKSGFTSGSTWGIDRNLWKGGDPTTMSQFKGWSDITTSKGTAANVAGLKSTYSTLGGKGSGYTIATGGYKIKTAGLGKIAGGGFTPQMAPAAGGTGGFSWLTGFLTPAITNQIVSSCAQIFTIMWQVDGVCTLTRFLFDDTLHIGKTMDMLNKINWSVIPSKMFLASTIITLDAIREDLAKQGIEIQGNVPSDVLQNFDATSSTGAGSAVKQKADIVSEKILGSESLRGKKRSKITEKQIKKAVEGSLIDAIVVYYSKFNQEEYDERMKRAKLGADVGKRKSSVNTSKTIGTVLATGGLIALGSLLGGPLGGMVAGKAGTAIAAGSIGSLFMGSKIYNDAEAGVDQLYASDKEFDSAIRKAEKSMASKEASKLADLLIALSKDVKGIPSESFRINNPNLLNSEYIHDNFDFRKLVNESRLNEITSSINTVSVEDVLSELSSASVMVFGSRLKKGTPEYKEALAHTVTTVVKLLKSYFGITVTGAEKYKADNFMKTAIESKVNSSAEPGQPASQMIAQANNGTSPPSMNSNGNMNDMMQLANMSGGNNMMMLMMMMMMSMSGQSSGGLDIMKLMQQLNGGKVTIGDAAQKISEEEGMEGFADAIELAISEANGRKETMSGARVKQLYQAMNKNPLSKINGFTLNSKFAKGSSINSKVFVEEIKRYINIEEKASTPIDDPDTQNAVINFLKEVFFIDSKLKGNGLLSDGSVVFLSNIIDMDFSKSVFGCYYLNLINSSKKSSLNLKFDNDTTISFNDESHFKQLLNKDPVASDDLTVKDVSEEFVKMLKSVNKFLSEEIQAESVRTRKQNVDILTENYYKLKLSNILFEEKAVKSKAKSKKPVNENEINLRQEWLNIWDI